MPLPYSEQDQPLDGKPPAYGELFRFTRAQVAEPAIKSDSEKPETENRAIDLQDVQNGALPLVKLAGSSALIAEAVGIAIEEIPWHKFSKEDAGRFAAYVEKNIDYFKAHLPEDPDARKAILGDVDKMMQESVEPRRRDVLLRWFRDPAAPANLNPMQLVDPKEKAEGNLLQLVHPVVFNAILLVVSIAVVVLVFAYEFRGGI
jgi:hypothetical protein